MKKNFWARLLIPLGLLFVAAFLISEKWPLDGFFLNLATEIIGIIITITYVHWVLGHQEKQRWQSTDIRINDRLRILLNMIVSGIRNGLGFSPDILDESVLKSKSLMAIHNEIIRVAEHVISPVMYQRLQGLDSEGWETLTVHITNAVNSTLTFLNTFQVRMHPRQISLLLDLYEALSNSLTFYRIYPDLAGVPKDELPPTRTSPEVLLQSFYEETTEDLQRVLALTKQLSEYIDKPA
jgi:hypothetical protein